MTPRIVVLGLLGLLLVPDSLAGQFSRAVLAGRYESYSFKRGLAISDVSEFTVPIGADVGLGPYLNLSVSSAYARIAVTRSDDTESEVSGLLDTEVRLAVQLIPGKLVAVATGVVPTGIRRLQLDEVTVLGAVSSDVIGFAAPSIGTGGSFGGGLVGGVAVGSFALGLGATYKYALPYRPIRGQPKLRVGPEFRGRIGLEGPLGPRTYLRVAGVLAARGKDEFGGATVNGIGHRGIGYVSLSQGFGNHQLSVYGFDVYRASAQVEETALGAALLPKGNILAAGTRLDLQLARQTVIAPRGEFRLSSAAPSDPTVADQSMTRQGRALRFGLDIRQQLAPQISVLVQGDGVFGDVRRQSGTRFTSFSGYRAGLFLTVTP